MSIFTYFYLLNPLAKNVLIPLGLPAAISAKNAAMDSAQQH